MPTFNGKIVGNWSEPTNNAPVVVDIETDHGIVVVVPFERQLWNAFVDGHPNINDPEFRVEVSGRPWQRGIRCLTGCEFCPAESPAEDEDSLDFDEGAECEEASAELGED